MSQDDVQRLEERLANLEEEISQLTKALRDAGSSGGSQIGGGMQAEGGSPPGEGTVGPGAWLAGLIAQSITPPGSPGSQLPGQSPGMMPDVESLLWCTSRFICASMACGGSGWC